MSDNSIVRAAARELVKICRELREERNSMRKQLARARRQLTKITKAAQVRNQIDRACIAARDARITALSQALEAARSFERNYYVLHVWEDVEPVRYGPFETEEQRDQKAHEIRREHGIDGGLIAPMTVDADGTPVIDSYSGFFFEEDDEQ